MAVLGKTYSCDYLHCHGKKRNVSRMSNNHIVGYISGSLVSFIFGYYYYCLYFKDRAFWNNHLKRVQITCSGGIELYPYLKGFWFVPKQYLVSIFTCNKNNKEYRPNEMNLIKIIKIFFLSNWQIQAAALVFFISAVQIIVERWVRIALNVCV